MDLFNSIPRRGRFFPCLMSSAALFARGKFFPDRDSIVILVEKAFLPCWRYALDRIMENYTPGDSWLHAVRETEKQHWSAVDRTAPAEK